jgi:hypothetical protein
VATETAKKGRKTVKTWRASESAWNRATSKLSKLGALLRVLGIERRASGLFRPLEKGHTPARGRRAGGARNWRACSMEEGGRTAGRRGGRRSEPHAGGGNQTPPRPLLRSAPAHADPRPSSLVWSIRSPRGARGGVPLMPTRGPGVWALTPGPPRAHGAIGACFHSKQLRPALGATAA